MNIYSIKAEIIEIWERDNFRIEEKLIVSKATDKEIRLFEAEGEFGVYWMGEDYLVSAKTEKQALRIFEADMASEEKALRMIADEMERSENLW